MTNEEKQTSKSASILMRQFCLEHGENLDEPVMEYLASVLVDTASDETDCEAFLEMINEYFSSPVNLQRIQELVSKFTADKEQFEEDNESPSENQISSSLNAEAEAFFPQEKLQVDVVQEVEWTDFVQEYLVDPTNDPLELLLEMFPFMLRTDVESVYLSNNEIFSSALEELIGMKSKRTWIQESDNHLHPTSLDLSEEAFPELQPAQKSRSNSFTSKGSKESFLDIAKKPAAIPLQSSSSVPSTPPSAPRRQRSQISGSIPWVVTGEAVSKQYAQLRSAASEFAKLRNACFSQATKAYVAGNKALAKELGEKGRIYCDRMKNCHHEASEAIFKDRNQQLRRMMEKDSPEAIDLHGLHVAEARRILDRELRTMQAKKVRGRQKVVNLLVGTGHHTKGARTPSRLPAAVESFLQESGFTFRKGAPGVIEVDI